jgi:hypothetical protein
MMMTLLKNVKTFQLQIIIVEAWTARRFYATFAKLFSVDRTWHKNAERSTLPQS